LESSARDGESLAGRWFHTGDQGEVDAAGNWKIIGRIKSLIILASGHNVAPEPIEEKILQQLKAASQVVLVEMLADIWRRWLRKSDCRVGAGGAG